MNVKKKLPLIVSVVGVLSLIGAVLLLFVAAPNADAAYKRVLEILIGVLMLLLSGLAAFYVYVTRDAEPNFFLFDRAKKRNIPVENLTFTIVNERMRIGRAALAGGCAGKRTQAWLPSRIQTSFGI